MANTGARHACNLPLAAARPQVITQYILKECAAGHSLCPFLEPPLPAFVVNALGAVPKKRAGTLRLIMHLSFPPGDSINDGISVSDFPLRYSTVYDAMDSVMHLGRNALMAKIDVKGAFRLCPIHPADHHLLGYQWQGRYYYDRVLPFGLCSAPYIFNCLADAIEWLVRQRGITQVHHYTLMTSSLQGHFAHQSVLDTCSALLLSVLTSTSRWRKRSRKVQRRNWNTLVSCWTRPTDKLSNIKAALFSWMSRRQCSK